MLRQRPGDTPAIAGVSFASLGRSWRGSANTRLGSSPSTRQTVLIAERILPTCTGSCRSMPKGFDILRNKNSHDLPEDERFTPDPADIAGVIGTEALSHAIGGGRHFVRRALHCPFWARAVVALYGNHKGIIELTGVLQIVEQAPLRKHLPGRRPHVTQRRHCPIAALLVARTKPSPPVGGKTRHIADVRQ